MKLSPISGAQTKDGRELSTAAVASTTGEVTWSLITHLIEKGLVDPDQLSAKLDSVLQEIRFTGPIQNQTDEERLETSLALQRVIEALRSMG